MKNVSPYGGPGRMHAATRIHRIIAARTQNAHVDLAREYSHVAERLARGMIARHGIRAAHVAALQLNKMIDRGDLAARDLWACVVHAIHEEQDAAEADGAANESGRVKNPREAPCRALVPLDRQR